MASLILMLAISTRINQIMHKEIKLYCMDAELINKVLHINRVKE